MPVTTADKRAAFRKLHDSGCFIIPNPFDPGSAVALQHLGFKALASTSAGFAWTIAKADNKVTVDEVCDHLTAICSAVDIPVNADFAGGFAHEADKVGLNVARGVATGVAGRSIEDSTGNKDKPLYDADLAVARIKAARQAIGDSNVMLTGRCEAYLVGKPDLGFVIERLKAYSEAGAECLYAPGIKTKEDIAAIVKAVAPKPVNVLVSTPSPDLTVSRLADLGVRRISVGSSLARVAWGAFVRAAREIQENGTFDSFAGAAPFADLNGLFRDRG
jgi:2-methylisocitrate lyase-like PEP mutase family enzyme